jgi:hypothetical protein
MISGIENSVESLKRTFPKCLYFAITEFADFSIEKQNYATTFIDEIYVLRKQRRSDYRTTDSMNDIDPNLIDAIAKRVESYVSCYKKSILTIKQRMRVGTLVQNTTSSGD